MESCSDSDSEMPETVSSADMKSQREIELRNIFTQKKKVQQDLKLKRKLKAEKYQQIKKEMVKDSRRKEKEGIIINAADAAAELLISDKDLDKKEAPVVVERSAFHKKYYPKYNIVVESLSSHNNNPRAIAAINFKNKRLGSIPRENVASTLQAYHEKMLAKNS